MPLRPHSLSMLFPLLFLSAFIGGHLVHAFTSYANDFVDPDYILAGGFPPSTQGAQSAIIDAARDLAAEGPWSVMNKSVTPPSGDKHDYESWAPYWWPDCSNAGNTTVLAPEQIWTTCTYVTRDGLFNPDGRLVNDVGAFQDLSDAVLYNGIAWAIQNQSSSEFSQNIVKFIKTWFLDDATKMNPNLNYAQMERGPTGQNGTHTGVLDLKGFVKIVTGVLILRKGKSSDWTTDIDNQFNAWSNKYITWLETATIAIQEEEATNNHGTFFYNQLAALKILVGDLDGANKVTQTYFNAQYMSQIVASGEQPLEAARTRPYHYRAYNLAAMITNARLDKYTNPSSTVWNKTTTAGATIQTALDFALTVNASTSNETDHIAELYPNIAAVAATYGDPDGKYVAFLKNADPGYAGKEYFLWNQPLAGEDSTKPDTNAGGTNSGNGGQNANVSAATGSRIASWLGVTAGALLMSVLVTLNI